jgi:hypothetical protein
MRYFGDEVPTSRTVEPACESNQGTQVRFGVLVFRKWRMLHRDEQGTISILSVVVMLLFTMLLGMILNVGEQVDDKIRMQNAADAVTMSSGIVVVRSMNTIAFTNHLLSEVFALTAYFREGRDRHAESFVPEILDAWSEMGEQLTQAKFYLFRDLAAEIPTKIEMERQLVRDFGDLTAKKSRFLLPALEVILGDRENAIVTGGGLTLTVVVDGVTVESDSIHPEGDDLLQLQASARSHLIPQFQRQVVRSTPLVANTVAHEIMNRHFPANQSGRIPKCVLYTTAEGPWLNRNQNDPNERIMPVLDPTHEGPDLRFMEGRDIGSYQAAATKRRRELAQQYLNDWNSDHHFDLGPFERDALQDGGRVYAKFSQFLNLWRGITCAKLNQLLEVDYPTTNLPHMLRQPLEGETQQEFLDREYLFSGIVYRSQRPQTMPGMYRVPNQGDAIAFSRVVMFVPRPRYGSRGPCPQWECPTYDWYGQMRCTMPCYDSTLGWSTEWNTFNQNWTARMVPTSPENSLLMLGANPQQLAPGVKPPPIGSMSVQDFKAINTH